MARKKELVLIGGGGHCKSCIDVIEAEGTFKIVGIVDKKEKIGQRVLGYEIFASDGDLPGLVKEYKNFFVTIGSIADPSRRIAKFQELKQLGVEFPAIISPLARVARSAKVGEGTIIMHNALVNSDGRVGVNCIINTSAVIEHESIIGDHSNISTGSIINGTCVIGNGVFIGSGSVVFNNIDLADGVIVGGGSVVTKSICEPGLYLGNPARRNTSTEKLMKIKDSYD